MNERTFAFARGRINGNRRGVVFKANNKIDAIVIDSQSDKIPMMCINQFRVVDSTKNTNEVYFNVRCS